MNFFKKKKNRKAEIEGRQKNLLMAFPTGSRYAEAYRNLRTNLHFSAMEKKLQSLVVTSSVPSEGKTTTAINLAYTIAQTGKKTLLVDCDLRKPLLTEMFDRKKNQGLTDLISDTLGRDVPSGNLSEYSIGDNLQLTKYQKKTGHLNVASSEHQITFYFINGLVTDILWHTCPPGKKLAAQMQEQGKITQEDADIALEHQKKTSQRLGDVFYTMGFVAKPDLEKILGMNALEALRTVSLMKEGSFEFISMAEEDVKSTVSPNLNFEKLYRDFFGLGQELTYINKSINEAVYSTEVENLFVLGAGKVPPNPAEIIGSDKAEFLMDLLKQRFDFVVVDTPPVLPATDSLLMAPRTDGVILVVRSGHTNKKVTKEVVEKFQMAKLPILGVLLNRVDIKKGGYYNKYYQKYYAAYYGNDG